MRNDKKGLFFLAAVFVVVAITCIGAYSNYNKCEDAGGELVRGWFYGPRCLVIEREIEL